jgi:hypothetical protein
MELPSFRLFDDGDAPQPCLQKFYQIHVRAKAPHQKHDLSISIRSCDIDDLQFLTKVLLNSINLVCNKSQDLVENWVEHLLNIFPNE